MTSPIAYMNGRYLPIDQASLHVFDLGIVGGMSVTEMVRTFQHKPFRLDEHLARFARSLQSVGFQIDLSIDELKSICETVVAGNSKLIAASHDLGLIVFVTAGSNPTYTGRSGTRTPTMCVHTFPLPFELWAAPCERGLHLVTVNTRNIPGDVVDPRIKHRSRLHWHLAAIEAHRIDLDATAILMDADESLTETASGNLCIVKGSKIITPAHGVLEGISRDYVADLASSLGLEFVLGQVTANDLSSADEAFVTSTPNCLLSVTRFNFTAIGTGRPGAVYQRLVEAWSRNVGVDIVQQIQQGAGDRLAAVSAQV